MPKKSQQKEDALHVLRESHREIENLYARYREAEGEEREEVGDALLEELEILTAVKMELFYPGIDEEGSGATKTFVAKAMAEQKAVRNAIEELRSINSYDEEFDMKIETLLNDIATHHEEEESDLFGEMEQNKTLDLLSLGQKMLHFMRELRSVGVESTKHPGGEE